MKVFLVEKNEKGEERFVESDNVYPGQILAYVIAYANTSAKSITGVKVDGPVPKDTVYVAGSAINLPDVDTVFSIDDGASYSSEPVKYRKKTSKRDRG